MGAKRPFPIADSEGSFRAILVTIHYKPQPVYT